MTTNERYVSDFQIWLYAVLDAFGACETAKVVLDREKWYSYGIHRLCMFINDMGYGYIIGQDRQRWWEIALESTDPLVLKHLQNDIESKVFEVSHQRVMCLRRAKQTPMHGDSANDFIHLKYGLKQVDNDLPF